MLPDDYRYEWTVESLDLINDADEDADLDDLAYEIEADTYTHELTRWLGSRPYRYTYVDQRTEMSGHSEQSVIQDLMAGQEEEKREVYTLVLEHLRAVAEGIEDEEEEE